MGGRYFAASVMVALTLSSCAGASPGSDGVGDPHFPALGNGGYDATHYLLDLSIDVAENRLDGVITMTAVATQDLSSFNLDVRDLEIFQVTVNDTPARFEIHDEELTIVHTEPIEADVEFTVEVDYGANPELSPSPPTNFFGWRNTGDSISVTAQPDAAHSWYPVNDHPNDKAAYSFDVTVPQGFKVAANGYLVATESGEETVTYRFESPEPIASNVVTINVGEFEEVSGGAVGDTRIRHYLPPDVAESPPSSLARTAEMLEFFEALFGPHPFDEYGVIVVDGLGEGALEAQTVSMFGRPSLASEETLAHELAHSWFGNSVTPASWDDYWLSEGFATYASWLWTGDLEFPIEIATSGGWPAPGDPPEGAPFHSTVYIRGALVLHALRLEVGDESFFEILRTFHDRFRHSIASTEDFIAVADELTGVGADWFEPWLYADDPPPLPGRSG